MLNINFSCKLNTDKEALITSVATFVLASMFYVMAFILLPAIS